MLEGSRGKRIHSTTRARGLAACALAVLMAAFTWEAQAQGVPVSFPETGEFDTSSALLEADPSIATDGAGNWVAIWASDGGDGGDTDIYVRTSGDNGATWTAPVPLTNGGLDEASPSLATNGSLWVAAWTDGTNVSVATSNDAGATWVISPGAVGTSTSVDVNAAGVWVAASVNGGNLDTTNSSGANANVGGGAANPAIATDGGSNWVVAFESGGDIGVSNSTNNGAGWSTPTTHDSGGADAGPFVGYDPALGTWIVLWNTDSGVAMIASTDGSAWSPVSSVVSASADVDSVSAATDANGNWTLVFAQSGAEGDIAFSTSSDNGVNWSAPQVLSDTETDDGNPDIATDGSGQWITVFDVFLANQVRTFIATAITTISLAGDGGGGGPCFIASAAYGTPMAKDIEVLRELRDTYLMNNALGLFLVDTYYTISPAVADQVATHPWAASLVRALLIPVLLMVDLFMRAPVPFLLMGLFGAGIIVRRRMAARRAA